VPFEQNKNELVIAFRSFFFLLFVVPVFSFFYSLEILLLKALFSGPRLETDQKFSRAKIF
jgi:hypothetical protein